MTAGGSCQFCLPVAPAGGSYQLWLPAALASLVLILKLVAIIDEVYKDVLRNEFYL
jgi:hypothetical protein